MKRKLIENLYMSVGVMEDYKLRDLRASHTDLYIQRRDLRLSLVRGAFFSVFPLFFPDRRLANLVHLTYTVR
jgi:hypothetical protein